MINVVMAIHALKLCGIENPVFSSMVCHDPDQQPYNHTCDNALKWIQGERFGYVSGSYQPTEMKRGKQCRLPFGGFVSARDPVTGKIRKVESALDQEYSEFRFSQYGQG